MLEVTDIYKSYKKKAVLRGISFQAKPGDCIGIAGSNGCGKTTLLSILAGVSNPDQGSIRFDGKEAVRHPGLFEKHVGYVPQENPIMEELTVRDNMTLWFRGNKAALNKDLEDGVSRVLGIPEFLSSTAGKLSGGQKKRLSIACALSNQASVLILDEPGAALDLICKEEIRKYLIEYCKKGGIVLLTSHEMMELSLCDTMYILKDGLLHRVSAGLSAEELIKTFK